MSWDLRINQDTNDLDGTWTDSQDEILQRVKTRCYRMLGEWFANITAGIPWYKGNSNIIPGELTSDTGILGSRNFEMVDLIVRNEISSTEGVIQLIDFSTSFDTITRAYSMQANIVTQYGLAFLRISSPS